MAEDSLKDFLRQQARGLDSLLELTPAKHMFGEDNSDQWKRKKQTTEQKKAARMAKLDPANWKSAKDVYDERSAEAAKKRKLEQVDDETEQIQTDQAPQAKKQKQNTPAKVRSDKKITEKGDNEAIENANLRKKLKKRKHRLEKNQKERERQETAAAKSGNVQKNVDMDIDVVEQPDKSAQTSKAELKCKDRRDKKSIEDQLEVSQAKSSHQQAVAEKASKKPVIAAKTNDAEDDTESETEEDTELPEDVVFAAQSDEDKDDNEEEEMSDDESTAPSSEDVPEILSPVHDSASSSVSSIQPSTTTHISTNEVKSQTQKQTDKSTSDESTHSQSEADREAARQRLQSQISQFRAQRKADNKPVQTRAELLDERRRKEAERKATKKEQRRKEKEEEARKQDEEIARRFSPGGSVTGSLLGSPRSPMIDEDGGANAFSFGRIAFADGTSFDPTTKQAADAKKRKGPSDAASALRAAQAKQGRIAGLDEDKKADIAEKDMWLNAKKRAHGEKVKDDTSLLKKALKRQDKDKKKSEKEWTKRTEGVQASQDAKQKRRTENLQKRKDEKGSKKPGAKKPKRAGFEGSFKGRTGKNKK